MKLANLGGRACLIVGDHAVDIQRTSGGTLPSDPLGAVERWSEVAELASTLPADAGSVFDPDELCAPVPNPRQIFAIGLNYHSHAQEVSVPPPVAPPVFTKFVTSLIGPRSTTVLPSETIDWEAEVVVVIGAEVTDVQPEEAWSVVAGVMLGQDLTDRTVQNVGPLPQFSLSKSFPGFSPTGPWITSLDELADPDDISFACALESGERLQAGSTSDLIFSVPELIARLSAVVRLLPGDLIFTGTPGGVGFARRPAAYLTPGDVLVTSGAGLGGLRSVLVGRDG